jgi:pimeloyl-ACP methyl ester carboxylesterase
VIQLIFEDLGMHYEVHGEGEPLILLNGIMMSALSWKDHVPMFKKGYQIITYDMRDQGQSARLDEGYTIDTHVEDLKKLLDHLNIDKVNLLGVSYGSQVALLFVLKYPERVNRMILPNATDYIDNYLQAVGEVWKIAARSYDGEKFFDLALPFIYSRPFYDTNLEWLLNRRKMFKETLTKPWFDGLYRLACSNADYDVRDKISKIDKEVLFISGEEDILTPHSHMMEMHEKIENSTLIKLNGTGHALFFEKLNDFMEIINDFL